MFSKHQDTTLADLSLDLSNETDWKVGTLRKFTFPLNVTCLAVEPVAGLLAAGTGDGFIYIFGGPSVESKISLQETVGVRFLHFSISTYFLLCLDENNQLHIYNLLEFGRPKPVTSARFDHTNSLTLSPSHTHVFLAMRNGEVKTYDLTCLRKSPYTIPNLWKMYEETEAEKGLPSATSPAPRDAIETVVHPRNLNLLFVAYSGGIVLTDLSERNIVRAYELILRPGAPGGAGYGAGGILTHRRPLVTSIAIHPTGHLFAVGYEDGSIAFWAVDDDEKPLVVRTLGHVDVDRVALIELEKRVDASSNTAPQTIPDPIFKISWSGFPNSADPRGGETVLTILGGHVTGKRPGVTVFAFPAFDPPEPPVDKTVAPSGLHPAFRQAMCQSIAPNKSFYYESRRGVVQDYALLPRDNPHFGSTYDPYVMFLIFDTADTRTVEAVEFPPPGFVLIKAQESEPDISLGEAEEADVQKGSQTPTPKSSNHLRLLPLLVDTPFTLSNARSHTRGGCFFTLENVVYESLIFQKALDDVCLNLRGGQALVDLNEQKVSKYQPRRILVTHSQDNTVRFFDFSTTLLIPSDNATLRHAWPKPITSLTIWLDELFDNTSIAEKLSTSPDMISIQSVQVAAEALEVGVALTSGEVIIYHSVHRKSASSTPPPQGDLNPAIVLLDCIRCPRQSSRLLPYFMLCAGKPVETFALSDIGFLAVAYKDGTLTVIDMRGPRMVLSPSERRQHKHRSQIPSPSEAGPEIITSLRWSICPLDKDPRVRVRLIAILKSGGAEIYTPICSGNPAKWSIFSDVQFFRAVPDALPDGTFVLDTTSGSEWRAVPAKLAMAFKNENVNTNGTHKCILVSVGAKHVRVTASINGEKVSKLELGSKLGHVVSARVIAHNQSHALAMQTDKNDVLIYTLPHLEHVATLHLPNNISALPLLIDESGDFISWSFSKSNDQLPSRQRLLMPHINGAIYGTFFDHRRAYPLPDIDFTPSRGVIPPQPQPVSLGPSTFLGGLGSWLPFNQTISGPKIDELLGGPDRPIPERIALEKARSAEDDANGGAQSTAAGLAASAVAVQANLYNRLTSALGERGQLLGDLEERFNSLEEGSRNMVTQAKRLATQQTAKSWLGF